MTLFVSTCLGIEVLTN